MKELAKHENDELIFPRCKITVTSLEIPEDATFREWETIGDTLRKIDGSRLWWWGDWCNHGERRFGEKYTQALEASDYSYQGLANAAWVARQVDISRRRENLTWSHHLEVAHLKPADQDRWLARAEEKGLKRGEIRRLIQAEKMAAEPDPPKGQYRVIVVDPPWPIEKIERDCRPNQRAMDYPTLSLDEIAARRPPAAKDAHLWLWTTHRFLPDALKILEAWGAKYICTFVWHKPGGFQVTGLPQFNCEFAVYGRLGSPEFTSTKGLKTCFTGARGAHSEKPEEFYDMIREATAGPRIDMYNRRAIAGFKSWGNEAATK